MLDDLLSRSHPPTLSVPINLKEKWNGDIFFTHHYFYDMYKIEISDQKFVKKNPKYNNQNINNISNTIVHWVKKNIFHVGKSKNKLNENYLFSDIKIYSKIYTYQQDQRQNSMKRNLQYKFKVSAIKFVLKAVLIVQLVREKKRRPIL